jgi:hypothetical protein
MDEIPLSSHNSLLASQAISERSKFRLSAISTVIVFVSVAMAVAAQPRDFRGGAGQL